MSNPYALPSEIKKRPYYDAVGYLLSVACILETLGFWGGMPNPPLAVFYGVAATYILRC